MGPDDIRWKAPDEWADGAIGFGEDRGGHFVVKQDRRGWWRTYYRQTFESSFGGGWGRIDYALHHRDFAIRSDETGNPLTPRATSEEAIREAVRAIDAREVLPYGQA